MITPVVGHSTCALDQQRRLREARADSVARAITRRRRRRGRPPPSADQMGALVHGGEDVWQALR